MSDMIQQGTVLYNAFNKEAFIFSGLLDDPAVARFEAILDAGGSSGGNALVHVHPRAEEHFIVKSGCLRVVLAGKEHTLHPGEKIVVPRGTPHFFANGSQGRTEFTTEFRPAQQHLRFFANFGRLAQYQTRWFSANGDPHLLLIALVLSAYRDHLYLAGLPILLQKIVFAALAPLARVKGYRLEIRPTDAL
jgi:quercetin dioxygenase-like cupin family protein